MKTYFLFVAIPTAFVVIKRLLLTFDIKVYFHIYNPSFTPLFTYCWLLKFLITNLKQQHLQTTCQRSHSDSLIHCLVSVIASKPSHLSLFLHGASEAINLLPSHRICQPSSLSSTSSLNLSGVSLLHPLPVILCFTSSKILISAISTTVPFSLFTNS